MFVDDHSQIHGGLENTVTVRLSREDLLRITSGRVVVGKNKEGNRLQVVVLVENDPQPKPGS